MLKGNPYSRETAGRGWASDLTPATAGSAGLDLEVSQPVTLVISAVHLVPTGVWGPIWNNMRALLI